MTNIWAELEAKRNAAIAAQVVDGRGRTSLVRATADDILKGIENGDLKPNEKGVVTVSMRENLGKKAAAKFESVQRKNAARAGMSDAQWYVGQEVVAGKLSVTLSYMVPVPKKD